jgi:hypothetical protein
MNKKSLKILFLSADRFPPFRVDVTVLFGKEMIGRVRWSLRFGQLSNVNKL